MRLSVRAPLIFLLTLTLFAFAVPLSAHGYILRSFPENRAVLERPPTRLQYWFSEGLEPNFSKLLLRNQAGDVLAEGGVDADDATLMALRVPANLPEGAYIVELRPAFAADGHVVAESRVFFVGEEVGEVSGAAADYTVPPLEVVWRVLVVSSSIFLLGIFGLYSWILVPAWGSDEYPSGLLPPRVMRRLNILIISALIVSFGGNILALLQQAMIFFNTGLAEVISSNLWSLVRIGSRFGDVWNVRMLLLALAAVLHGLSLRLWKEQPRFVQAFWSAQVWAFLLIMGTFSVNAHAAGSLLWPWLAMLVDWLHGMAVGLWIGGLAALVLILPVALQPYSGETRRQALLAVLRRYSRLAAGALAVVIASGIYSALNWLYTPADVTGTAWGGALLIKSLLVIMIVALGLAHHISANPERYAHWSARIDRVGRLSLTLRLEVLVAVLILISVAWLSATPVPEPQLEGESAPPLSASQTIGDLTLDMTISPGGTGVNTYDTVLRRGEERIDASDVQLQFINPQRDWRGEWHTAERVDDGLYVTAGADLSTDGEWLTVYDVIPTNGDPSRFVFDWTVTNAATVIQTRQPGILNIIALVAVVVSATWAIWPLLLRFYHWLDWSPVSVAVAVSSLVALVLFLGLGWQVAQQSTLDYEATLNPPPALVNPILPTGESLTEGAQILEADCPGWDGRVLLQLTERLNTVRDEQLYAITETGWQGLPACEAGLQTEQRWNLVNFIRTLDH